MKTHSQRSKEWRQKMKEEGRCIRCGEDNDRPQYTQCSACIDYQRGMSSRMREIYTEKNKCPRCGGELQDDTAKHCVVCTTRRVGLPFGKFPNEMEV
jgi:hypothetical protein